MSPPATEKMVRSRNDSPAPRAVAAPSTQQEGPACKGQPSPTPSISVVSFLTTGLLLGRSALLNEDQQSLDDGTTWTALIIFLAIGAVVMHFDVLDIAKQEATKESGEPPEQSHTQVRFSGLFLTSLVVLLFAVAMTCLDTSAVAKSQLLDQSLATGPLSTQSESVNMPTAAPFMREQLYSRAAKLKGTAENVENVFGRYFDASLVRGTDYYDVSSVRARRCANAETIAVLATSPTKSSHTAKVRRWSASVSWSNETSIFFLSVALALGLATSRSDRLEMTREDQDNAMTSAETEVHSISAEKFYKPSQARGKWRLLSCIALLLATAASLVASFSEDM